METLLWFLLSHEKSKNKRTLLMVKLVYLQHARSPRRVHVLFCALGASSLLGLKRPTYYSRLGDPGTRIHRIAVACVRDVAAFFPASSMTASP